MARTRRHNSWLIFATLGLSLVAHPGAAVVYDMTREPAKPVLRVLVDGDGDGIVMSAPVGIRCGSDCSMTLEPGSLVKLTATIGENSTFEGWTGPCGSQAHVLFAWAEAMIFPGTATMQTNSDRSLQDFLRSTADRPLEDYPLECEVTLETSVEVSARFGTPPEVVEVAMIADATPKRDDEMSVSLPKVTWTPEELVDIEELLAEEEEPLVEAPQPLPLPLPLVEPPPPPPKIAETPKMKAVEVPDQNEVDTAPEDAKFLSDKNRNVEEETHATETNLDKQLDGERIASAESAIKSEEIGGEEEDIAQTEELEATALDAERNNDEAKGAADGEVVFKHRGQDGEQGEEGEAGNDSPSEKPGLLSMRNIEGRGALGSSGEPADDPRKSEPGTGGISGRSGSKGQRGPKLQFDQEDYQRIVGKEVADSETAVAQRKQSRRRGRWERKLGMLKSSLENFTPEVRPGNQTALKTRAAPFALYIARMHRRIHELWGFGFLEDLDSRSSSHELNNWNLVTKLEIVINPDGSIHKMTIAGPSGVLSFDVAALDVIDTAGPYEPTPAQIRSPDGKVYMHWSFHRDWRQCGTFGAEPFILASAPANRDKGFDDGELLRNKRNRQTAPAPPAQRPASGSADTSAASARANVNLASPDDPAAQHTANLWLTAFVAGNASKMANVSSAPFRSGESVVATSVKQVEEVYESILKETASRRIKDWKLLSAAGYRKSMGALPPGINPSGTEVLLLVRFDKQIFTLVLNQGNDGYKVSGLHR